MNFAWPLGNNILLLCVCESQNVTYRMTDAGFVGLLSWVTHDVVWCSAMRFSSLTQAVCVLQSVIMRMDSLKRRTAHLLVSRRSKLLKLQHHSSGWPPHIEGTGTGNRSSACCFLLPRQEKCMWRFSKEVTTGLSTGSCQRSKFLYSFSIHVISSAYVSKLHSVFLY